MRKEGFEIFLNSEGQNLKVVIGIAPDKVLSFCWKLAQLFKKHLKLNELNDKLVSCCNNGIFKCTVVAMVFSNAFIFFAAKMYMLVL